MCYLFCIFHLMDIGNHLDSQLIFIELPLWARHCPKCFTSVARLDLTEPPCEVGSLISPLLIYEALNSEKLNNLTKVTHSGLLPPDLHLLSIATNRFLCISSEKLQVLPVGLCPVICLMASGCFQLCLL